MLVNCIVLAMKIEALLRITKRESGEAPLSVHLNYMLLTFSPSRSSFISPWTALCHFGYVMGNKDEKLDRSLGPRPACRLHPSTFTCLEEAELHAPKTK